MTKTKTPRIAHFLPHYPGRDGTAAFCRGLSRAMNRIAPGACPIITLRPGEVTPAEHEELLHYPREKGWNPFRLPANLVADIRSNRHRLDGVVLHGTYNPPMISMARELRKAGIGYLFIPHDPYSPELRNHSRVKKLIWWHVFEKRLIENATALQLLDQSHECFLRELGCKVSTFVIPNGCEPEMLDSLPASARLPGCSREINILYFGRMDRNHKGLDLLLEGYAKFLKAEGQDAPFITLVMTGNDWTDRGFLEELAVKLGIEKNVRFTGRRPEGAMEIVADADLVVLTSRFDGFGLCIVEAMLAGRPVLVSNRAGVASHVQAVGGGWVVEPNPDAICEGLAEAFKNRKQWQAIGKLNQRYVLDHLTWEQVARKTLSAYSRWFLGQGTDAG